MRLFRKTLLALAAVVLVATFTACESDDNKDGNLYVSRNTVTSGTGRFAIDIPIDIRDIRGFNRYDNIYRIDLFESYLNFFASSNFERGDIIEFTLYTDNIPDNYYTFEIVVDRMSKNVSIDYYLNDRGNAYGDFVQELFDEIGSNGGAMLRIDGRMYQSRGTLSNFHFGVEMNANVDILMW